MKRKICYGQMVRVVGADWTFLARWTMFDLESRSFIVAEGARSCRRWWPEYLLEAA